MSKILIVVVFFMASLIIIIGLSKPNPSADDLAFASAIGDELCVNSKRDRFKWSSDWNGNKLISISCIDGQVFHSDEIKHRAPELQFERAYERYKIYYAKLMY